MDKLVAQIRAAQNGDLVAYGDIVREFQDMACGCAYAKLGDFQLAEDAAQEAFVEARRKLGTLREPKAFPGWFRRVVLSQCSQLTRRRRVTTVPLDEAKDATSPMLAPDRAAEEREMKDEVLAAIGSLPDAQRMATTLFYINGYSQDEVADFLEVPVSTVKKRLHDSRRKLKERMVDMVADTLKAHVPDVAFGERVLERMRVESGRWSQKGEVLSGIWGGARTDCTHQCWGRLITKESWPGDAIVVEFDAIALSGLDGAHIQLFMYPRRTPEECKASGEPVPEFFVEASCFGKYHWSEIKLQTFDPRWSRHMMVMHNDGEFCGRFNKWYRIRAERIRHVLRLWIDGVPIYERELDSPPPKAVWPVLGADVSYDRFRNLTVCRPENSYIEEYSHPVKLFSPYRQRVEILDRYPSTSVRNASIVLEDKNKSDGITERPDGDGRVSVAAGKVNGKSCRRTDLAAGVVNFGFQVDDVSWDMHNDVRMEIEYLDRGRGALTAFYESWYHRDTATGDIPLTDSGKWKTCSFPLRDVGFRDLGEGGCNFWVVPLRCTTDLCVHSVRLMEQTRSDEAYDAVLAAYDREIELGEKKKEWTVPHYRYRKYLILQHNLKRRGDADNILRDLIDRYPDSEWAEEHHLRNAQR